MFDYNSMRYVHLDFHTPELVKVGDKFNAAEFADTIENTGINTIAIFALCHHGYVYYDTKVGVPHPQLKTDLVGGMAKALRKKGIQALIYFSQNVNETLAMAHPEYAALGKNGKPVNSQVLLSGDELYWTWLCPNRGKWVDEYLFPLIKETLSLYECDGIFMDMAGYLPGSCYCEACKRKMKEAGLDINNPVQHEDFLAKTNQDIARKLRKLLDSIKPGLRLLGGCFNRLGDAHLAKGVLSEFYLETLPAQTGWFLFPFLARYFRNIGLPVMGMTGRFLNNWGDFGTVKTTHQLKVELATHLAAGVSSGIGDHMHCNGKLDKPVYKVIGEAFEFIKERQPYCVGAIPVPEIIMPAPKRLSAIAAIMARDGKQDYNSIKDQTGLSKMLSELHYQWDISNPATDFNSYGALVLNHASCELSDIEKIISFTENGGTLIACHEGLNAASPEATESLHNFLGIKSLKMLPDPGVYYHVKAASIKKNIPDMPLYTHTRSCLAEFEDDVESLADIVLAPFIRSREHFYGHFHGAPDKKRGVAIGLRKRGKGAVIAIAPSLFYSYMKSGNPHHINLIRNIFDAYFPEEKRMLKTNAPGLVEITLSRKGGKLILQAVPFISGRRDMDSFETLNDAVSVAGIKVWLKSSKISRIHDPIKNKDLKFTRQGEYATFKLPAFSEHFLAVISDK
jgi:hypothetical protein